MKVTEMKVNGVSNPLGYQLDPLSLSWKVEEAAQEEAPQETRITVWKAGEKENLLYDSTWKEDLDACGTELNLTLQPRTAYEWKVQVRGSRGSEAEGRSSFETGKLEDPWSAEWITSEDADTPAVFRKKFEVRKKTGAARLYILGLGVYEAYLNGKKVGDEYLAPGYHSYDLHLQYQTYAVEDLLQEGENELAVYLGDGWYRGRLGFEGGYSDLYGKEDRLIAELWVQGECIAKTDESWEEHASPAVFSNIYDGEIFDARILDEMGEGWKPVKTLPAPAVSLTERYSLPVKEKERFAVKEIIHTPKGETVLDFGQEVTGWPEFHMPAEKDGGLPAGEAIRFTGSEILQDGCFYNGNYRTAKTQFTYISDGKERPVRPHHTFYGFRYLKAEKIQNPEITAEEIPAKDAPEGIPAVNRIRAVKGDTQALGDEEIRELRPEAVHLRSDFDSAASISTGDADVNQLISNATWGQKDNFLDVPTDCPQRDERLGWTGDAQIFSETACLNMDTAAFYRKFLWDMRAEQALTGGEVANVVPRLKAGMVAATGITPWADAGVVIPWNVYRIYGSKAMLWEAYPGMKAWTDCARRKEESKGGPHLNKDPFSFGDWLALDNPNPGPVGATDSQYIASAYYYQDVLHTAQAARILGYEESEEDYEKLAGEILKAIRDKYFDKQGLCTIETQTAAAIAIMFDLCPTEEAEKRQGDILAQRVHENRDHLNTGFVGTPFLCPALSRTGHHDLAVTLLLNRDLPSWLYCVKMGATTIWERWNSVEPDGKLNPEGMNSLNHYSYGSILGWMYQYLAGIRPAAPGFKTAEIRPQPDARLGHLECTMDTASGKYVSCWKYEKDGSVKYHIEVPAEGMAVAKIGEKEYSLGPGKYDL